MSNLSVLNCCIKCGGCLGLGYDFLYDDDGGNILVKEGTFLEADDIRLVELKEVCPVGAFTLDLSQKKKTEAEQLDEILATLKSWEGIPDTIGNEFPFNIKEYHITTTADSPGAHSYKYNSESAAERAAEDEFDRIMFSKINTYILQILSEYRVKKLKPWFSMSEEDRSVYVAENKRISEKLEQAKLILGDKLPDDFAKFDVWIGSDITYKSLNRGEFLGENYVSTIRAEFDSNNWSERSYYRMYFDIDSREELYTKKGLFGEKTEYKTTYCYSNVGHACRELADNIKFAFDMKSDDIMESAAGWVNQVIYAYNSRAKEILKEKIALIESLNVSPNR